MDLTSEEALPTDIRPISSEKGNADQFARLSLATEQFSNTLRIHAYNEDNEELLTAPSQI